MSIQTIEENLLDCKEYVIVHQCNCCSYSPKGLSKSIFEKYPEANVYTEKRKLGTIEIRFSKGKCIVALYAQYYPGGPRKPDDKQSRLEAFKKCLDKLANYLDREKIIFAAFPYNIGCGLAKGNWADYYNLICRFAIGNGIHVKLYKHTPE
jgi:hypothetical protein